MSNSPPLHDGQGDAMPCACPACAPVAPPAPAPVRPAPLNRGPAALDLATRADRDLLREARAC